MLGHDEFVEQCACDVAPQVGRVKDEIEPVTDQTGESSPVARPHITAAASTLEEFVETVINAADTSVGSNRPVEKGGCCLVGSGKAVLR
jgi:hypothetical protein